MKKNEVKKVQTFRMADSEFTAADKLAMKQYGVKLSVLIREMIYDKFPSVRPKPILDK